MNTKTYTVLSAGLVAIVLLFIYFSGIISGLKTTPVAGSIGNDSYNSTTTDGTWSIAAIPTQFKLLKNGPGVLGSVVITQAIAGAINLYDGTTTNSANRTIAATTTLAKLATSVAAGTYTFDTAFSVGLIAEFPTALGVASSTITWK